jgi:hypothetical protein
MSFEHFERGYLLPKGCKDLLDAINLQAQPPAKIWLKRTPNLPAKPLTKLWLKPTAAPTNQPPPTKGDLLVPEHTTVRQLAALLGQKPLTIVADAMVLGLFANVNQTLGFEAISHIARKYGYTAKRAA